MASSTAGAEPRSVRVIGMIVLIAGIVMIVLGTVTWAVVSMQLSEQNIIVAEDSSFLAGDKVDGPFSAYAQAQIINVHAQEATGGMNFAELDQDDPLRVTAMNASFLRASLFTSVVAFGVSALAIGLGVLFGLLGGALRALARPDRSD